MKLQEFRKLIREEVRNMLKEDMNEDEILQGVSKYTKNNEIRFGTINGATEEMRNLLNALRSRMLSQYERSEAKGRSYYENSFDVKLGGKQYTVIYSVDSSD